MITDDNFENKNGSRILIIVIIIKDDNTIIRKFYSYM
jgi:hypothetical protein